MSSLSKKLHINMRQSAKSRLPLFNFGRKTKQRGRRAKHFSWRQGKFKLSVSVRYFRTSQRARTKRPNQIAFSVRFLPVKELSLSWFKYKRQAKKQIAFKQLAPQALAYIFVLIGLISSVYFINQLGSSKKVVLAAPKTAQAVKKVEPASQQPKTMPRSEPIRLRIAKVNIEAPLVAVGYKPDGSLEVPGAYDTAGWYKYSPAPGELGPAVIAAHLDSPKGPAIFWRLGELLPEDIVEVDRADGTTAKFKVDEVKQYPQTELPSQEIFGNIKHSGIRLITCSGVFNPLTRHYSHNTVVYGSLAI